MEAVAPPLAMSYPVKISLTSDAVVCFDDRQQPSLKLNFQMEIPLPALVASVAKLQEAAKQAEDLPATIPVAASTSLPLAPLARPAGGAPPTPTIPPMSTGTRGPIGSAPQQSPTPPAPGGQAFGAHIMGMQPQPVLAGAAPPPLSAGNPLTSMGTSPPNALQSKFPAAGRSQQNPSSTAGTAPTGGRPVQSFSTQVTFDTPICDLQQNWEEYWRRVRPNGANADSDFNKRRRQALDEFKPVPCKPWRKGQRQGGGAAEENGPVAPNAEAPALGENQCAAAAAATQA